MSYTITKTTVQQGCQPTALTAAMVWMAEGDEFVVTNDNPEQPPVKVEKTKEGWVIEGSVPQKTPADALKALLGFFGIYQPL